jgi:hypothetical protein
MVVTRSQCKTQLPTQPLPQKQVQPTRQSQHNPQHNLQQKYPTWTAVQNIQDWILSSIVTKTSKNYIGIFKQKQKKQKSIMYNKYDNIWLGNTKPNYINYIVKSG